MVILLLSVVFRVLVIVGPDVPDIMAWSIEENIPVLSAACEWGDNWLEQAGVENGDIVRRPVCQALNLW